MAKSKEKKEKVVYVDDGRTIADMSGITGGRRYAPRSPYVPGPTFKEAWKTYWSAVKMMFVPMLMFIGGMGIIYLLVLAAFTFLA